jgi:hypothetical protein
VPVGCGGEGQAAKVAHIPVWACRGTLDEAVPVGRSRNMAPASRAPEMMRWLFPQKRP